MSQCHTPITQSPHHQAQRQTGAEVVSVMTPAPASTPQFVKENKTSIFAVKITFEEETKDI